MLVAQSSLLAAKKSCKDDSFQAGDEARSAESLQNKIVKKSKRRRCDRKSLCRAFGTFYIIMVMNAGGRDFVRSWLITKSS
jgi:D-Tyr-tRNAtyr deacylase